MGGTRYRCVGDVTGQQDLQGQRVLRGEARRHRFVRGQPTFPMGMAVPRCHRGGNRDADLPLFEAQQLRVLDLDDSVFAGLQVAQVGGVQALCGLLDHDGRVAVVDGLFVTGAGLLFLQDGSGQALACDLGVQGQQGGAPRQGKGVDHLQVAGAVVAVGLPGLHDQHQAVEVPVEVDRLQRDGVARGGAKLWGFGRDAVVHGDSLWCSW